MKLTVKDMDIKTGGILIAIINKDDAHNLDLFALDRVTIKAGKRETVAIVDIAESKKAVPKGSVGMFEELIKELGVKNGTKVELGLADKPRSNAIIKDKLDGKTLTEKELEIIVNDIVNNNLSDVELTYFMAACYNNGLTNKETLYLTKSIANNGNHINVKSKIVLDKHCSGGVPGNRTSMVVVPILAAAGLKIPKTSSRAITSPAGTADTVEVLSPVTLPKKKIEQVIQKTNGCLIWGGGMNLAGADDKMIKVRYPLKLDPEGLLLSSIVAKKVAVGATHLLADLPVGPDTKLKTPKQAQALRKKFMKLCSALGIKVKVILTDGSQPIGNGIGPTLEARDVLWLLKGDPRAPLDLKEKSIMMAAILLEMAGKKNGKKIAREMIDSGKAYKKFIEIIRAQGGKKPDPDTMYPGDHYLDIVATKSGRIRYMDCKSIAKIARLAGAPQSQGAGIFLYKHVGDHIYKGETVLTIYSESQAKLTQAENAFKEYQGVVIE